MVTTKLTGVDEVDDPLTSAGPVDPGIAHLIRQDVQATIKGVYETFYAPPSYSSIPPLSSTPADDDADAEAQQPATPPSMTLWDWGRFVVIMAPMFIWILSWAVLVGTGIDPLALSMLAFLLVLALIWFIIIVCAPPISLQLCTYLSSPEPRYFYQMAKRYLHPVCMHPNPHGV